jgi:hypothetical protein
VKKALLVSLGPESASERLHRGGAGCMFGEALAWRCHA